MKVGIIGAGHIAEVHGPAILNQKSATIVGIADKNLTRAKETAERLRVSRYYESAEEMIHKEKPDVVHVLVPPQFHSSVSIAAMKLGCHVLVEKPMALTNEDAIKMIEVAQEHNVKLCVDHNLVYTGVIQQALKAIEAGKVGEPVSVEICYLFNVKRYPVILEEGAQFTHWSYRMNGGPLQDQIPHPASLLFELIPEIKELKQITTSRRKLPGGFPDEVKVLIDSGKMMGYLSISFNEKPDTITFTVKGTEGSLTADLFTDILTLRQNSYLPRAAARGLEGLLMGGQYLKGFFANVCKFVTGKMDTSNGIEPLVSKFYEAIQEDKDPPISYQKSLHVVDLISQVWPEPLVELQQPEVIKTRRGTPTALVTGASGFIGTHLVQKLLSENRSVRALVRPGSSHLGRLVGLDIDVMEGDLTDPKVLYAAAEGVQTIFHAGSPMTNNWKEYEEAAVAATATLIQAGLANNVDRFVQFSSLAVYELLDIPSSTITEEAAYQKNPKGMGPYAWAKIETEKMVLEAWKNQGLKATIVRLGIVLGPMGNLFFPHLGFKSADRLFILIGKGDTVLPLTYIENTVDAIYRASLVEKAIGQIYQIVDDAEVTIRQYLDQYVATTGIPAKIISLPAFVPYSAAFVYEIVSSTGLLKKGITSRAQLKWKQAKVHFDNRKIKEDLGWIPNITMHEGLRKSFEWYASKYR